jgi:hypothetical protein
MDPSQLSAAPRFRYRKLNHPSELDDLAAGISAAERPKRGLWAGAGDSIADSAGAVHELGPVTNGSGTVLEICALLARGALAPEDLVNDGTGWQSLDDHPAFDDACEPSRRRDRWVHRVGLAVAVVAVLGFILLRLSVEK